MDLWHCLLTDTKNRAKQRMTLSDNVANNVVNRFMIMSDDCQRIAKKVRMMRRHLMLCTCLYTEKILW